MEAAIYRLYCFSPNSLLWGVLNSFFRCVRPFCHCWCPPSSAGHAAFLSSIHLSVSRVISLRLSPRFGACTAGVRPFPLATQHFYSFVSHVISFLLSPGFGAFSAGHAAVLFICLPCAFLTFASQVRCLHCWCPPCPLAMQHFYSIHLSHFLRQVTVRGSQCFLRVSPLLRDCVAASPVGHCVRLVSLLSPFVSDLVSLLVCHCVRLVSTVSAFSPFMSRGHCVRLVSLLSPFVSGLASLLVGHCVRLVSLPSLLSPCLSPFLLVTVSALSPFCLPLSHLLSPFLLVTVSALYPFCFLLSPFLSPFLLVTVSSCLPSCWSLCHPFCFLLSPFLSSALSPFCFLLSPFLSLFLLVIVSAFSPFCLPLFPFLLVTVSALSPFCSLFSFLSPFVSLLVRHCLRLVSPALQSLICLKL